MTKKAEPLTKDQIKAMADRAEAGSQGRSAAEAVVDTAQAEGVLNAEIKILAALPIGVYESSRVEAAKRLHMRASVLDALVEAKRAKPTKEKTDFLPHWNVEPWPESVDGAALLDDLRKHFTRYVVLPKHTDVVAALISLHSYVFDCFDITPYLAITSPTRRCGKTLLMTVFYWLCCRAKKNDSMSKAAIYRSVEGEKPTLILDEVGWVVDLKDERQGILCGGFERLGHAELCEGEGANIVVRRYSTYCPKVFGLIGRLTPTLMDRAIEFAMQRKKRSDKVERLRRRDNADHARFRQQCLRWANDNRAALPGITPQEPSGLNDRAFDVWEPLLVIAEHVGGEWPKLAREAAIALSGGDSNTEEKSVELLADIKTEFDRANKPAMRTKELITALCADEERPWAFYNNGHPITDRQLAGLLKPFAIISETVHASETGEAKAKGYRRERFTDAFDAYLSVPVDASAQVETSQACKRASVDETGITDDFSIRAETDLHGCENSEKPANDGGLHACTLKNPQVDHAHGFGQGNGGNGTTKFRSDIEDAYAELALRGEAGLDDIPSFLDRRHEVCGHCGQPGGTEWDYRGLKIRLHDRCQYQWIDAYEASHNGSTVGSSL